MKRKNVLFILVIFTLLASSCRTAVQKVSADELTDEHILLLMEAEGYDISSPHFSCIYNERVIYGPNYTAEVEFLAPETPVSETESQSAELPSEDASLAEESPGKLSPPDPKEIIFNEPYSIPENSFVSESTENEDELDILAQWEAFLEEETYIEEKTEKVTELSTELTELTELTQITETIIEETKAEILDTKPLVKKPQLPRFKPIMVLDPVTEKVTELAIEPVVIEEQNDTVFLCFVATLACGAGVVYLRSKYAQKNNKQTK
jgi:hypothetical protein